MSRRIVRYEGEGRHRRPVYDEPLAADLSIHPPAPIERRLASDAERSGFAPRIPANRLTVAARPHLTERSIAAPAPIPRAGRLGAAEHLRQSRLRGTARHVEVITARRPPAPPLVTPKEPVMEDPAPASARSPETQALLDLAAATSRTDAAWLAYDGASTARIRAEEEYELARRALVRAIASVNGVFALQGDQALPPDDGHAHYAGRGSSIDEALADLGRSLPVDRPNGATNVPGIIPSGPAADGYDPASERQPSPADEAPEVVTRPPETPAASMASFAAERAARAAGGGSGVSSAPWRGGPGDDAQRPHASPGGGDRRGDPARRERGGRGEGAALDVPDDHGEPARDRPAGSPAGGPDSEAAGRVLEVHGRLR
jgi:hypothetical protein